MKTDTTTETATRLASLLVELLNHPKRDEIIEAAAQEAHNDSGAEARHTGDLLAMISTLGRNIAEAAEADCRELSDFYDDESREDTSKDTERTQADSAQHAQEYLKAADSYFEAGLAFASVATRLDAELTASGI